MSKWEVKITESEIYVVTVDADTEDEAHELALDAIESDEGKASHHNDSDGNIEAYEL